MYARLHDYRRGTKIGVGLASALFLGGCATYSPDGGLNVAREIASRELRQDTVRVRNATDVARVRERVNLLLRSPLGADAAVQIALLNNRGLQAAYNDLGMAEVQFVQATLPPSPTVSLARWVSSGGTLDIDR